MALMIIIALVFALYWRTLNYNYVIDDNVKRQGYMYDVPLIAPPVDFLHTRPSKWYRLFMIGMHCVNVSIIYLLWGWCPALLFAVHPMSVWGTAWVTGNYYATAAYFTLIAYFILHTFPNVWGALVAMPIFAAALNSTVDPITFPFLFLFTGTPWGLTMFLPLIIFLKGRKFTTGMKIRNNINNWKVIRNGEVKVNYFRRFAVMTKVVARYTYNTLNPDKMGFFSTFGTKIKEEAKVWNLFHSFNRSFWLALAVCLSVFIAGLMINPFGILWFFVFIGLHSQFNLTGQFYAQRYIYLANVGMCIVLGTLLQSYPIAAAIVATIFTVRTHCYIPIWKNMENVWINDMETFSFSPQAYNNLAQYYLQHPTMKPWEVNKVGYLLCLAEHMNNPLTWEIQMNLACFFARIGQLPMALQKTDKAIELLEPLGGLSAPLDSLKKQKIDLEKLIEEGKQKQGELGKAGDGTLSHPPKESTDSQGGRDGKSKEEGKETRILEPVGVDRPEG